MYFAINNYLIVTPYHLVSTVARPGEAVMFAPVTVIVPSSTLALDTVQLYTPSSPLSDCHSHLSQCWWLTIQDIS